MVAITFLMSSLARLRVSARTVRPAMLAGLGPRPSPRLGRLPPLLCVLVNDYCVMNPHKTEQSKMIFIISQFLWVRNPGMA